MKINGVPVGTTMPRSDWNQTNPKKADFIKNKEPVDEHLASESNPHKVTAEQVGAYAKGNNNVLSKAATGFGDGNTVGLLGYYYSAIDFENKTVTLSTEQGKAVVPENLAWAVGDVVSIVNGGKYEQCAAIVGIDGHVLTLDNIPFDKIDPSLQDFDDRSIYVSAKPEAGVADLGKGAIAMGVHNKSLNRGAVALGEDNEVTAQYGTAIGRLNKVHGYAGFANGRENVVHPGAKYGRASGLKNQVWGEESVAEGHECKANAKGAKATGYKTVANGEYSETAGWEAETTERASYSFAGGQKTVADAWYAFVTGLRTISSNLYGHFVTGRYNKVVSELFTIGCGTSDDNRQNALGVKLDGTIDAYGHKITNVAAPTNSGDALAKGYVIPVAEGGTGAIAAAEARNNLGLAAFKTFQKVGVADLQAGIQSVWGSVGNTESFVVTVKTAGGYTYTAYGQRSDANNGHVFAIGQGGLTRLYAMVNGTWVVYVISKTVN